MVASLATNWMRGKFNMDDHERPCPWPIFLTQMLTRDFNFLFYMQLSSVNLPQISNFIPIIILLNWYQDRSLIDNIIIIFIIFILLIKVYKIHKSNKTSKTEQDSKAHWGSNSCP